MVVCFRVFFFHAGRCWQLPRAYQVRLVLNVKDSSARAFKDTIRNIWTPYMGKVAYATLVPLFHSSWKTTYYQRPFSSCDYVEDWHQESSLDQSGLCTINKLLPWLGSEPQWSLLLCNLGRGQSIFNKHPPPLRATIRQEMFFVFFFTLTMLNDPSTSLDMAHCTKWK